MADLTLDRHRPRYHFLPTANWMNDPNGFIQWESTYHLFYQYNPDAPVHENMHWGHAASKDLVHWLHLPVALSPTPGGPDTRGCWSGVTVDDHGTPTIIYSGAVGARQRACLATSSDGLMTWQKYAGNPVIPEPPDGLDVIEYHDHSVWREDGDWYQVMGAGIRDVGGAALLYRSSDLRHWEYLHPLCSGDELNPDNVMGGTMWECPDFFGLDGRHVLITSVWDSKRLGYAAAAVGEYRDHRFFPRVTRKLDHGDFHYYAPQSTSDRDGRRIVLGWVQEGRSIAAQVKAGWSGAMSLLRELQLAGDGWLCIKPVPELEKLRAGHMSAGSMAIPDERPLVVKDARGDALELQLVLQPGAGRHCGAAVRRTPDGEEQTSIVCDPAIGQLIVDRAHASLDSDVRSTPHRAPLTLSKGEPLRLRVFVDRSILEVYANDTVSITTRIYPSRDDSQEVALLAELARAQLLQMDAWPMASIWTAS